jgi:hypothetical protein
MRSVPIPKADSASKVGNNGVPKTPKTRNSIKINGNISIGKIKTENGFLVLTSFLPIAKQHNIGINKDKNNSPIS